MSDKIRPTESESSGIVSSASDLYHNVMAHEGKVWNNVTSGKASPAEYAEAGAETLAAIAIGKFGLKALSRESAASTELKLFTRGTVAEGSGAKVLDMEKYKFRFAGSGGVEAIVPPAPAASADVIKMTPLRRPGFLGRDANSLEHIIPRDFREKTSSQAPSLDALTGELKF